MTDANTHHVWRCGSRTLALDRPRVMAIVNATPDSFFDGGRHASIDEAVAYGLAMLDEGADVLDVGGESTRPGADRIDVDTQIARTRPVIEGILAARPETLVSIDTTRAAVAEAALDAGAAIVNDVSACLEDDAMLALVAARGAGLVLMHRLRPPNEDVYSTDYETAPEYGDVVDAVARELAPRVDAARSAGIADDAIVLDPGLGFGKSVEDNFALIAGSGRLGKLGFPLLGAASRKSFIGAVTGAADPADRLGGSLAAAVTQYRGGVRLFRVHDVAAHRHALAVAEAVRNANASAASK